MNSAGSKPSLFISYAHADAMDFARRLEFALQLHLDVYRDIRLQTGEYPPQLLNEIQICDFFLLVMSPHSLRDGGWCRRELDHASAIKHDKIALAKIYPDCHNFLEKDLSDKYTFGDFTSDFEQGFRRLTEMFLHNPYSSWEGLPSLSDIELLENLKDGRIPALISKEIIEWVLVEKLFESAAEYAVKQGHIFPAQPRTLRGILYGGTKLIEQAIQNRNFAAAQRTLEVMNLVRSHMDILTRASDNEHLLIGQIAFDIIRSTHDILTRNTSASGEMFATIGININFELDVAENCGN